MSNKKVLIGSLATFVAAGALGASVTHAHLGKDGKRSEVRSAIERGDYNAFKDVIGSRLQSRIDSESDFLTIVEAHQLRQDGRYKAAHAVLERAGIEHPGHRVKKYRGNGAVREAVESGNWERFREMTKDRGIGKKINTEEKFELFIEAHKLREDGRHDEAKEIFQELGIHQGKKHHHQK